MVIVIRGDPFPRCRFCKDAAVFILVDSIPYIAHDLDFAGPAVEKAKARIAIVTASPTDHVRAA